MLTESPHSVFFHALADDDDLVFEDPYGDDIESESDGAIDEDDEDDAENEDAEIDDATRGTETAAASQGLTAAGHTIGALVDDDGDAGNATAATRRGADVWRPGVDALEDGDRLEYDPSAYVMYHALAVEWPCLSFDVMPDRLGLGRARFPLTMTLVAGTQADTAAANKLMVMRLTSLHKTQQDGDSDDSDDDDDDSDDDDPGLDVQRVPHPSGAVNRVRVMPQAPHVVASWSDAGIVHLWDVRPHLRLLDAAEGRGVAPAVPRGYGPVYTFTGHETEGYAVDWSAVALGRLVTGDCRGRIHVWDADGGALGQTAGGEEFSSAIPWQVEAPHTGGHKGSVEDLQWSPNEAGVFASAGVDGTVRIWDARTRNRSMLHVQASDVDVNVISWSKLVSYLLASGAGAWMLMWQSTLPQAPWNSRPPASTHCALATRRAHSVRHPRR